MHCNTLKYKTYSPFHKCFQYFVTNWTQHIYRYTLKPSCKFERNNIYLMILVRRQSYTLKKFKTGVSKYSIESYLVQFHGFTILKHIFKGKCRLVKLSRVKTITTQIHRSSCWN